MRRTVLVLAVPLLTCAVILVGLFQLSNISLPEPALGSADISFVPHPGVQLPLSAAFTDEHGRNVRLGDYFAKAPVILVLDYLRCTSLCGVTLRNLVLDGLKPLPVELGRDYELVAISIDPRDTPSEAAAAQAKYATLLAGDAQRDGMHFLTGSAGTVRQIADVIGFRYRYDSIADAYLHPAGFVIASPRGVISRYIEGVAISPRELINAFSDAEEDKSQGPLTRLLLFCHVQGARLGHYSVPVLAAFTMMNVAAVIALIAIFNFIRRHRYG